MEKVQKAALSKEGGIGRTQTFDWENDWSGRVGGLSPYFPLYFCTFTLSTADVSYFHVMIISATVFVLY